MRGYRCTFANAYHLSNVADVHALRRQSVTTVASLQAFNAVRTMDDLLAGKAVYQDITRDILRQRGFDMPPATPEEAAKHLMAIADEHEFTLFEYFQTDLMAHKGSPEDVDRVLTIVDRFMAALLPFADVAGHLFIFTSDHGNIEDGTHRQHTQNPVPFLAVGEGADYLRERVKRLEDITPAIMDLYPDPEKF